MGFGAAKLTTEGVTPKMKFTDRVVRDKQYKLWVLNGKSAKLFDLVADSGETNDLINSTDSRIIAARKRLEAVVRSFPTEDARPKYDPTPPQPWDKKPN